MKKVINFVRYLLLGKYYTKKINKLKAKKSYESFEYLNKITGNRKLKEDEDYHDFLIEVGFIDENHKPLICKHCGSRKFFNCVTAWTDMNKPDKSYSEEVRCDDCGAYQISFELGRWHTF